MKYVTRTVKVVRVELRYWHGYMNEVRTAKFEYLDLTEVQAIRKAKKELSVYAPTSAKVKVLDVLKVETEKRVMRMSLYKFVKNAEVIDVKRGENNV